MLYGIDISSWQDDINLKDVIFKNNIDFVIAKATEGRSFVDTPCDKFIQTCIDNDTLWGFYHFANRNTPELEADYFYNATKNYFGYGIPILDTETGQSGEWCQKFVDRIHALTGVYPIIYTSTANRHTFDNTAIPNTCGLWEAWYPDYYQHDFSNIPEYDGNVNPWAFSAMWQFTSTGQLNGYSGNLDLDVAFMDREAWMKYADPEGSYSNGNTAPIPSTSNLHTFEDDDIRVTVEVKK